MRLCLGWELPQKTLLELRVACPIMIGCNFCWSKSLSKSWLDQHNCFRLQVLLVLCLISPLNDDLVVWAAMVLQFEKIMLRLGMYKQRIHSDFQIACPLPNLAIEW